MVSPLACVDANSSFKLELSTLNDFLGTGFHRDNKRTPPIGIPITVLPIAKTPLV